MTTEFATHAADIEAIEQVVATVEHSQGTDELLPSAYRHILALFEGTEDGLRAREVRQALGTGTENRHVENTRAKLKRLVSRGILTEPEPGLFTLPRPMPPTSKQNLANPHRTPT
ncbi:hypothetical protein [Streptomyces albicerus]|uniref:hypothetical protein n=1 Tax=Streptomyces albicerus TaxID=2569859 RepID=UPI001CEDE0EB|nr:hypothetical protein [Streptomyces albicerus]